MSTARPRRARDHLFVIRMWPNDEGDASTQWRAQITHVASRERHYFSSYGELCQFLDRCRKGTLPDEHATPPA